MIKKTQIAVFFFAVALLPEVLAQLSPSAQTQLINSVEERPPALPPAQVRAAQFQANVSAVRQELMTSIQTTLAMLEAQSRRSDPFGITTATEAATGGASGQPQAEPAVSPFVAALQQLPVDGIDPSNREFFVGARNIYQGDTITVSHDGRRFKAVVMKVTSHRITMRDAATGETAVIRLNIIPEEE